MDGQTTTDLDEAEGEVIFRLASGGLVEGHPPVVDHSREGAVVFVCVVGCVGFPWKPQRGHTNTRAKPDNVRGGLTLVPDGSFDGHTAQRMDHCVPQDRIPVFIRSRSVKSEVWCESVSEQKSATQISSTQISSHAQVKPSDWPARLVSMTTTTTSLSSSSSSSPHVLCSSPHCCRTLEEDQASTGVPP